MTLKILIITFFFLNNGYATKIKLEIKNNCIKKQQRLNYLLFLLPCLSNYTGQSILRKTNKLSKTRIT